MRLIYSEEVYFFIKLVSLEAQSSFFVLGFFCGGIASFIYSSRFDTPNLPCSKNRGIISWLADLGMGS